MSEPTENITEDKKIIEIEEREQMLNAENKGKTEADTVAASEEAKDGAKLKAECLEAREVKPKKIPIGGIQMPGFFTRSRSKEKCKEGDSEQGDIEGAELIDQSEKEKKEDTSLMSQARIKLPNPFRKSKLEDEGDKPEGQGRKKLMDAIRLPLVSVKKKKKGAENLENQSATAGLASSETLDDNDKSADKNGTELKNVPLDDKKDAEKQELTEEPTWKQKLRTYRYAISALLVFILFTILIIAIIMPGKDDGIKSPIRDNKYVEAVTSCGRVEGILDDGGIAFRGIPYARPPLGDLRFKEAQPINNLEYCWPANETFLAHNATDVCLQIYSNGTMTGTEDCLTLDIVTPYVRYENPLPVIVLIGAESLLGGSPGKMRPSGRFARSRDVVFVRPNFRLGALGFLALDMLSNSTYPYTSGNYGLSDIVEVLKWIQLNIEHFGGNKSSVTLFGHRAGATLVTALSTTRGAEKLFSQAWATSGGTLYPHKNLTEAQIENSSFLSALDCQDVECLRKMKAESIQTAVEDTWRKPQPDLPLKDEVPSARHEWLVLDGKILQEHPAQTWTEENGLKVKLVIGTTAHTAASEKLFMKNMNWTEELVVQHIKESFLTKLGLVDDVLKMYNKTYKGLTTMISDIRTVCPLFAIRTQMHKVPFYIVTQPRGELDLADVDSDVDAILGRYEPKTPEQRRYVSTIQSLFYYYVYHGIVHQQEGNSNKVLVIEQDSLPASTYSHCGFWIEKNIVPSYAQLD